MNKFLLLCLAMLFTAKIASSQTEVTFYTSLGEFVVETYDTLQPITSGNFIDLINAKFYDEVIFHRVISNFMIQGGDPTGTGYGGPGYSIADEFDPLASNIKKSIAMANSGPNTGGSQFFINTSNNTYLNSAHPVFGIVTSNYSVVEAIEQVATNSNDKPLTDVVIDSIRVTLQWPYVGINEQKNQTHNICIFPNPSENQITINWANDFKSGDDYSLKILNVLGKNIYSAQIDQAQTTIHLSDLAPKGIYFIYIQDKMSQIKTVQKVILQ